MQLQWRPPAADLQREMAPPWGESGLILVLAGGIVLHHWQLLLGWSSLAPESLQAGPLLPRLAIGSLALALPSLLFLSLQPWLCATSRRRLLYAMLPLLWGVLLARHLPLGMAEAGQVLPVSLAPLNASLAWPQWRADGHVIGFCQSVAVAMGCGGSLLLLRRLLCLRWRGYALGSVSVVALAALGRWLVELRV